VPAHVRFLSLEPLLGPLPGLDLTDLHWVIVGGESGTSARPMQPAWVTALRDVCVSARVAFFFKQWGGRNKKAAGRTLEGRTWDEMPAVLPAPDAALPLLSARRRLAVLPTAAVAAPVG